MLTQIAACSDLFHTATGTAYADLLVDGHRETWPIRSKRFRGWLRLRDRPIPAKTEQQIEEIGRSLSVDSKPLLEAWDLRCGRISPGPVEVPRLFDRYLTAVEELVRRLEAIPA